MVINTVSLQVFGSFPCPFPVIFLVKIPYGNFQPKVNSFVKSQYWKTSTFFFKFEFYMTFITLTKNINCNSLRLFFLKKQISFTKILIYSFLKECFNTLWKQGPSLMPAQASVERFGEKDLVFIKWRSCRHCFRNKWTLE